MPTMVMRKPGSAGLPTGPQLYSHTFYNGSDVDLNTVSPWVNNCNGGSYHIGYLGHPLIPSAITAYKSGNCYVLPTDMTSAWHWAKIQIDVAANTATSNDAGLGLVLRHNNHWGVYCKVMKSGSWRIYQSEAGPGGSGVATDANVIASGTMPRSLAVNDWLYAVAYNNTVQFYLGDSVPNYVLLGSGTITNLHGRYTGPIISMNNAGEMKNFSCGYLSTAPARSILQINKSGTMTGAGTTYVQVTNWTAASGTTLTSNAIVIQSGQEGNYGIDWRCNWSGGNTPRVMLKIKKNGVDQITTAAQDTVSPTSLQGTISVVAGDIIQPWWYGEGSVFTYPVIQAASTYLALVPMT